MPAFGAAALANWPGNVTPLVLSVNDTPLALVTVTVWAVLVVPIFWPANVSDADDTVTGITPTPLSATVCVLPATLLELSVMVNVPLLVPTLVGVKVTVIVQLAAGANVAAQVPPAAPAGLANGGPLVAMLAMFSTPLPVLRRVAVNAALVEPIGVLGKASPAGGTGEVMLAIGRASRATVAQFELAVTLA